MRLEGAVCAQMIVCAHHLDPQASANVPASILGKSTKSLFVFFDKSHEKFIRVKYIETVLRVGWFHCTPRYKETTEEMLVVSIRVPQKKDLVYVEEDRHSPSIKHASNMHPSPKMIP